MDFDGIKIAASAEILSEKSLRYKRNLFVIGVVLLGMHILPLEFAGMKLLGVGLGDTAFTNQFIVTALLWLAAIYNLTYFVVFGYRDFRRWEFDLTNQLKGPQQLTLFFFPRLEMYFGKIPNDTQTLLRTTLMGDWADRFIELRICPASLNRSRGEYIFEGSFKPRQGQNATSPENRHVFLVPWDLVDIVRRQLRFFVAFDLILPLMVIVTAATVPLIAWCSSLAATKLGLL